MIKSASSLVPDILKKVIESKSAVDHLKLQKLLYYTQAWSLVFREQPMFFEEIQAWVHGPVVPSVYHEYKCYGYQKISLASDLQEIGSDELQIIDLVCDVYGGKTGSFLEDLTHSESPWINARTGLNGSDRSNSVISLKEMFSYFTKFVETKQPPSISSKAVQIHGEQSPSRTRAFLAGMGSVLNIMPVPKFNHKLFTEADFNNSSADLEALQSDWSAAGGYFEDAIAKIKADHPQLNE